MKYGTAAPFPVALSLTGREGEILRLVSQGLNNGEIARLILVSRETVKLDLRNIYKKLGVRNRTQAAVMAAIGDFLPQTPAH